LRLRNAGIQQPILLLGYTPPWQAEEAVKGLLTPTVNTWQTALALSGRAAALGVELPVHIKVDSGLGRFGLLPEEVVSFAQRLVDLPHLRLEGLWTHFATADERDKTFARQQLTVYQETLNALREAGIQISCRHTAASAATLDLPEAHFDMVRPGISLYGLYPSAEVSHEVRLKPVMTLKARVARLRELPAGHSVSYGRTFITDRPINVALVPFGYGDGFNRALSNLGAVLIKGQRVPVIGRVCMDQFAVNVQDVPEVGQDDEVVILGRQGSEEISADEVASTLGTISYEIFTSINSRVPRVYYQDGKIVAVARQEESLSEM
jgi:alanine racemase